jgi:hypothetical protein
MLDWTGGGTSSSKDLEFGEKLQVLEDLIAACLFVLAETGEFIG